MGLTARPLACAPEQREQASDAAEASERLAACTVGGEVAHDADRRLAHGQVGRAEQRHDGAAERGLHGAQRPLGAHAHAEPAEELRRRLLHAACTRRLAGLVTVRVRLRLRLRLRLRVRVRIRVRVRVRIRVRAAGW